MQQTVRQAASSRDGDAEPLIEVEHLAVSFQSQSGTVHAVQDVSWSLRRGETLGVVGESGSGKSVTALALMGLLPITGRLRAGSFSWRGEPVEAGELAAMRGSRITMIFQDAMSSLDPLAPVGRQVSEVLRKHKKMGRREARERTVELFELVGIPEPRRRLKQYPFQFSGGMAQRVMIAMALAPEPDLIIADEPTTALDVTIQAQIMDLIAGLQAELDIAMVLITHDLGVVAGVADRLVVMYAGRVLESGPAVGLFGHPLHPYTAGLLASTPHPYNVQDSLQGIAGNPPVVTTLQDDCAFAARCDHATSLCRAHRPPLAAPVRVESLAVDRVTSVSSSGGSAIEVDASVLADQRLHRALGLAIRPELLEEVEQAVDGDGAGGDDVSGLVAFEELALPPEHDPAEARRLIDDLALPQDHVLPVLATDGVYHRDRQVAEAVADCWREAGLAVEVSLHDLDGLIDAVYDPDTQPPVILGWTDPSPVGTRRPGVFVRHRHLGAGGTQSVRPENVQSSRRAACWHVL